jgi:Xaa-Pro aminopeptidase
MQPCHTSRLTQLQALLPTLQVDMLLIENPTDLYYFTGLELSLGSLVITQQDAKLLVDGRYSTACQQQTLYEVLPSEEHNLKAVLGQSQYPQIGVDADLMPIARYRYLCSLCDKRQHFVDLHSPVSALRSVKDPQELELLRAAANLGSAGYDYVSSLLTTGCSEVELARALEIFWLQHGSQGPAFTPIIAFGANSALPHYHAGAGRLQEDDIVLIDIGVQLGNYHSDMTRVLFRGNPNPQLREIYQIVHAAQKAALDLCRAGVTAGDLDAAARQLITDAGYGQYFSHSLGHGVGLDIHESPRLTAREPAASTILRAGMVITVEPGIYLPGKGGVRLEDSVIVTETGYENLTQRPIL